MSQPASVAPRQARVLGADFPPPDPDLGGREALFAAMAGGLATRGVLILRGPRRAGKTRVAAAFAHRHRHDYDLVAWVDARHPDLIGDRLAALAPHLGVPVLPDEPGDGQGVRVALGHTHLAWLVVFDGAEDPGRLTRWLPRPGAGHVIITSPGFDLSYASTVDMTAPDEATLPSGWHADRGSGPEAAPAAEVLLRLCAFFDAAPIPVELFTRYPDALPAPLSREARDRVRFAAVVDTLIAAGLARPCPAGLVVNHHRAAAVRGSLPDPERSLLVATVRDLLHRYLPANIDLDPGSVPVWRAMLPHVLVASAPPDPPAAGHGPTSRLLMDAGVYLQHRGEHAAAVQVLDRGLRLAEMAHGPYHAEVGVALLHLAQARRDLGQVVDSGPVAARALRLAEHRAVATLLTHVASMLVDVGQLSTARTLLERNPRTADDVAATVLLAALRSRLGQRTAGRRLARRALRLAEEEAGPGLALRLVLLAGMVANRGPAAAWPLLTRALRSAEAAFGPYHPGLAVVLNGIVSVACDLGEFGAAQPLAERALYLSEAAYGPDHPLVGRSLTSLATVLQHRGYPDAARGLLERARQVWETGYGHDHPPATQTRKTIDLLREWSG